MREQFLEEKEKLKGAIPLVSLKKNLNLADEAEKKKTQEIAKRVGAYLRNKDLDGLKRYLDYTRKELKK